MLKSYDIRLYGTFLSEEGQRGVSQSMMGNHDTPWLRWFSSARQLSLHLEWVKPLRLYSLTHERPVCFFAKLLSLTSFSDQLRFLHLMFDFELRNFFAYIFYILDWRWAVGLQFVHASVRICVKLFKEVDIQYNRSDEWDLPHCQKRQSRQSQGSNERTRHLMNCIDALQPLSGWSSMKQTKITDI